MERVRYWWLILLALCLLVSNVSAQEAEYRLDIDGDIEIGPQGEVLNYRLHSELKPAVAKLVEQSVRRWRFEPVLVEGRPVIAKTGLHLEVLATPTPDTSGYRLQVEQVWFGNAQTIERGRSPRYPEEALYARLGADVLLAVQVDDAGRVVQVHPYQTSLTAQTTERDAARWRKVFELASKKAVRGWRFELSEIIGGEPSGNTFFVPIRYIIERSSARSLWRGVVPGPVNPIPWVADSSQSAIADSASRLEDGQGLALSSRIKLKSKIIGSLL